MVKQHNTAGRLPKAAAAAAVALVLAVWLWGALHYFSLLPFMTTTETIDHTGQVAGLWHIFHAFGGDERSELLYRETSYYPRLPALIGLGTLLASGAESIWSLRIIPLIWIAVGGLALYVLMRTRTGDVASIVGMAAVALAVAAPFTLMFLHDHWGGIAVQTYGGSPLSDVPGRSGWSYYFLGLFQHAAG